MLYLTDLADFYASTPTTPHHYDVARWHQAATYFRRQAADIIQERGLRVTLTPDPEPYDTAHMQAYDVMYHRHIAISTAHCDHPVWDMFTNVAYRIVHDVVGHAPSPNKPPTASNTPQFDVKGELEAWANHLAHMQQHHTPPNIIRVAFCETVLQLAYAATHHDFHPTQPITSARHIPIQTMSTIIDNRGA